MRMRSLVACCLVRLLATCGCCWPVHAAWAFNQSGHMDSVSLIVHQALGPLNALGEPERLVISACAQLPDMSQELDATKVYGEAFLADKWNWIWWGLNDELGNDKIREMFVVQQLVHGLTGGEPMAMRAAALKVVGELADRVASGRRTAGKGGEHVQALCALGIGLHLWGDTLAHTEVPWNGEDDAVLKARPPRMYATGRGHGFEGHLPDDVLCSFYTKSVEKAGIASCHQDWDAEQYHRRFHLWLGYVTGSGGLLAGRSQLGSYFDAAPPFLPYDDAAFKRLVQAVRDISANAHDYPTRHLEDLLPDQNDARVGLAIRAVQFPWLAMPPAGLQAGAPPGPQIQQAAVAAVWVSGEFDALLKHINELDLFDPEPSCRQVLSAILQAPGVAQLYKGQATPTCARIWQQYADVAIKHFSASIAAHAKVAGTGPKSMSHLVHPDWIKQYVAPPGASAAPVSDYANLVTRRLGQPRP